MLRRWFTTTEHLTRSEGEPEGEDYKAQKEKRKQRRELEGDDEIENGLYTAS